MAIRPIINPSGPGFPRRKLPSQLSTFTPAPFSPVDFGPLPKVRQSGSIELVNNILLTVFAASATIVAREPLVHTLPPQPAPFEYRVPNLLEGTLRQRVIPFVPADLSGPPPASTVAPWQPQRNELLTAVPFRPTVQAPLNSSALSPSWQPQENLPLTTVTAIPFHPIEQAMPLAVRGLFPFEPQNPAILAQSATVVPRTPLVHTLPTQPAPFEYRPPNLLTTLLTSVPLQMPSTPLDLGVGPANLWRSIDPILNLLANTLSLPQPAPFRPVDLSGLAAVQKLPSLVLTVPNIALFTTPQPQPFNQLDWPPLAKPVAGEPLLIPNTTINPGAPPIPVVPTTGSNPGFGQGGSGGGSLRCWSHKTHVPSSHRELCKLLDLAFDPQHEDTQDAAVVAQAMEIVRPYARPTVDYRALARDLAAVQSLRQLLLVEAAKDSDEDDDEMFLLL